MDIEPRAERLKRAAKEVQDAYIANVGAVAVFNAAQQALDKAILESRQTNERLTKAKMILDAIAMEVDQDS